MFINFKLYVQFLAKKKLNPTQFAICWMIHHKDYKNMELYNRAVGPFSSRDLEYLLDKGYILSANRDITDLHIDEVVVTPLFSDEIILDNPFQALEELKAVYPKYFIIGGKKQVTSPSDFDTTARVYFKLCKGDKIFHKIVLAKTKIVAGMMESGEMNHMKLDKYVNGRNWEAADLKGEGGDLRRDL